MKKQLLSKTKKYFKDRNYSEENTVQIKFSTVELRKTMPPAAKHVFIMSSKLHSCFSRPAKWRSLTWTTQVSGSFSGTQSKHNPLKPHMRCTGIPWTQPLLRASPQGMVSKYRSYPGSCSSKQPEDFWALHRTTLGQTTSQASQSTACSPRHRLMLLGGGSAQLQKVSLFLCTAPPSSRYFAGQRFKPFTLPERRFEEHRVQRKGCKV